MSLQQHWSKAVDYHQRGLIQQAEDCYRTIIGEHPHHAEAMHMLGMLLHQAGRSDEALPWLLRAVELVGDQPALLSNTALVHIERGDSHQAIGLLERALALDAHHFGSLVNLGLAHHKLSDPAAAKDALSRLPDRTTAG